MRQNHSALTKKGLPLLLCTAIPSAGVGLSAEAAQTQGGAAVTIEKCWNRSPWEIRILSRIVPVHTSSCGGIISKEIPRNRRCLVMKEPGKIKWMRLIRGIFLGILLVLTMTPAALGAQKTVLVHNVDEMMESLADNTEIVLAPGEYNLSNWQEKEFSERLLHCFDYYDSAPAGLYLGDGCTLDIAGFKDLTIRGLDTETITAEIVTEFPYTPVLKFVNCRNLKLSHLRMGHKLKKGFCDGAVLKLDSVTHMTMDHMDLYGCGTYGYEARFCSSILLRDSIIRECSYGLVSATDCQNLKFLRTTFKDMETDLPLFALIRSRLELTDCTFRDVRGVIDSLTMTGGHISES